MKKIEELYYNLNINKLIKITDYIKYLLFIVLLIIFVNKNFQNDTFYSIKVGELIKNNGIDFLDHFCFIKNLTYQYPHYLFDLLIYFIYSKLGLFGIYVCTLMFSFFIIVCLYIVNSKKSNKYISLLVTIIQLFLLLPFFTARAQIVTFILFILTYYYIEKFLDNPKIKYGIFLIIIPIIIANTHIAVFPFYFILYLPYFAEYFISWFLNKKNKKLEYYKLQINNNKNVKKLFVIFIICLFTGFITPLKNYSYTYLINSMRGISLYNIAEHQPIIIIEHIPYLIFLTVIICILIFSKCKIKLKDLFFFLGMTLLSFMSYRQISLSIIFNGFIISSLLSRLFNNINEYKKYILKKCVYLPIFFVIIIFIIIIIPEQINDIKTASFINSKDYPIKLVKYIKNNVNYRENNFFNEYDFGSYLLFNDIPVFIDSRADLYLKEFNKFDGDDIFTDYKNAFNNFDNLVDKYNFNYLILYKNNEINILIQKAYNYEKLYEDEYFVLWKI